MSSGGGELERECAVFTRYLLGVAPTGPVIESYVAAHGLRPGLAPRHNGERVLVRLAGRGTLATRLCDAYGRFFQPRGALRRKLVLLLAILESSPQAYRRVETVDDGGRLLFSLRLLGHLAGFLMALAAGTLVLVPILGLRRLAREVGRWRR